MGDVLYDPPEMSSYSPYSLFDLFEMTMYGLAPGDARKIEVKSSAYWYRALLSTLAGISAISQGVLLALLLGICVLVCFSCHATIRMCLGHSTYSGPFSWSGQHGYDKCGAGATS
mmetsp:Transcript_63892/g.142706  ORF Transcript_63892/g.142706 Transcript_63892/m.142706 type:complete len:115 (+) Transcript_63892:762-1106(+)